MTTTPISLINYQESMFEPLSAEQRDRVIAMLDEWCNADEKDAQEQRETGEYLIKALDEDRIRIGARTLFS